MRSFFFLVQRHCCGATKPQKSQVIHYDHCDQLQIHSLYIHFLLHSSSFTAKTLPLCHPVTGFSTLSSSTHTPSINFFDFPDNLLLKDGQDSIIFAYLFKHHTAVKLVAYLLEIIPKKWRNKVTFWGCLNVASKPLKVISRSLEKHNFTEATFV